ncbi:MAG: DUF268 domain-containing protein, partial [Verrucomicrobiota bacterium]
MPKGPIPLKSLPRKLIRRFVKYGLDAGELGGGFEDGRKRCSINQVPEAAKPFMEYRDESYKAVWSNELLNRLVYLASKDADISPSDYPGSALQFYAAFQSHPIEGQDILVVGSISPWVEAIALSRGASSVTTTDYARITCESDQIRLIAPREVFNRSDAFDAVCSFSSIEHDGLGRYGDRLNPAGDFETMARLRNCLKNDGRFYLGIPIGLGVIVGNFHRIYG